MYDLSEIKKICGALSSETRLKILEILSETGMSSVKVYKEYIKKYGNKRRETIYRELENLVYAGILGKKYNQDIKEIIYYIKLKRIVLDITSLSITKIYNQVES